MSSTFAIALIPVAFAAGSAAPVCFYGKRASERLGMQAALWLDRNAHAQTIEINRPEVLIA
jgi:hypothetical protein